MTISQTLLRFFLSIFILNVANCLVFGAGSAVQKAENQWESAIREFEEWDSKNSFPENAVLFLGSSSIRWWKTSDLFPEFPLINRGFGGASIPDITYFVPRIAIPYKPKVIVFYAGYNDLYSMGKTPEQVFSSFQRFFMIVKGNLPKTRIIFMSIKPGPAAWGTRQLAEKLNQMVKDLSQKSDRLFYADVAAGMLGKDGKPDLDDYQNDGIHTTYKADAKWAKLLMPTLKQVYDMNSP